MKRSAKVLRGQIIPYDNIVYGNAQHKIKNLTLGRSAGRTRKRKLLITKTHNHLYIRKQDNAR